MFSHPGWFDAGEQIVQDRVARAAQQRLIQRAWHERRVRDRFRRSVDQSLRGGLEARELWAQMRYVIRKQGAS